MKYVLGIDLGTSAVKVLLVNQNGEIHKETSKSYPLIQEKTGYSEQDPEQWVIQTIAAISELVDHFDGDINDIEGLSFSGQMHGLVLLDDEHQVLRNAILWNDTRTTDQCRHIYDAIGEKKLLEITKNPALEGFTLPKILWVKENEPHKYEQAATFLLPKDYVRYRFTGRLHMECSDAAGTLLLDVASQSWSEELCDIMDIDPKICLPLVKSHELVGTITEELAVDTGLTKETRVFAGGADNACGAIGSGILSEGKTLASIGTSGVVLSYEENSDLDFEGKVHYFNHAKENAYYTMGVTLSAGHSLSWFKEVFAEGKDFEELLAEANQVPIGSNGLLFTPYLAGERTPYADAVIRSSFIGMSDSHKLGDFVRAVLEGITFSLNESIHIFRENGKKIDTIFSVGGGAKSELWMQIQADIFDADIIKLETEQGPGMGAAMLAGVGCGWYESLEACADRFLEKNQVFKPNKESVKKYRRLYEIYRKVYGSTAALNQELKEFRK
ncbi:xylulokinase [Halobacillus seohaensis]|uniref:Xylulose kinase n=1 Tax=Halobacillus seohaensis TaxID=447421 RepID=A0ABW2ERH2_9BACI